jgi:hypothetical protein
LVEKHLGVSDWQLLQGQARGKAVWLNLGIVTGNLGSGRTRFEEKKRSLRYRGSYRHEM